jgi:ribosomal-protein-alanine N-acetyltransferase
MISAQDLVKFEQVARACTWTMQQYKDTLTATGSLVLHHDIDGVLVAYLLAQCVCDECELLQISVRPDFKRQGIANALMRRFIKQLSDMSYKRVLLEVRESNTAAISLYQKMGFITDGLRKGYYPSGRDIKENAVLMSFYI